MRTVATIAVLLTLFCKVGFSQSSDIERDVLQEAGFEESGTNERSYLTITPELKQGTLENGYSTIPFVVKNNSGEDIELYIRSIGIDGLTTVDDSGNKILIAYYRYHGNPPGGIYSGPTEWLVLKPQESITLNSENGMGTLGYLLDRHKLVFARMSGLVVRTHEEFQSYSKPFSIPIELAKPPWADLGEQNFFSVVPDLDKAYVYGGTFNDWVFTGSTDYAKRIKGGQAEWLAIEVRVTNEATQPYILAGGSVRFYVMKPGSTPGLPSFWDAMRTSAPILKPGQSDASSIDSAISLENLGSQGYKPGDKIVAAIAGRVPGTNQLFESYSPPFTLPPLPKAAQ